MIVNALSLPLRLSWKGAVTGLCHSGTVFTYKEGVRRK